MTIRKNDLDFENVFFVILFISFTYFFIWICITTGNYFYRLAKFSKYEKANLEALAEYSSMKNKSQIYSIQYDEKSKVEINEVYNFIKIETNHERFELAIRDSKSKELHSLSKSILNKNYGKYLFVGSLFEFEPGNKPLYIVYSSFEYFCGLYFPLKCSDIEKFLKE